MQSRVSRQTLPSWETLRPWANIASLALAILVNFLAVTIPLGGLSTGEVSALFPVLFTPANYVFGIWGLIYLGLVVFAIYQALPAQRNNPRLMRLGYLFVLSNVLNLAWLLAWQYLLITLSLMIMFGLLATLIMIYLQLEIGKTPVPRAEALCVRLPFSIYLGWITVATVANVSVTLYTQAWHAMGISAVTWTVLVIIVATLIGLTMLWQRHDAAFNLVLVWAFIGIAVARLNVPAVAVAAALAALVIVVALVYGWRKVWPAKERLVLQT